MVAEGHRPDHLRVTIDDGSGQRGGATHPMKVRYLLQVGLAACTASVVVAGHLSVQRSNPSGDLDPGFLGLLAVGLVPVAVFAVGTRRRNTVLLTGYAQFVAVAASWSLFSMESDPLAGMWVFYGWSAALGVAITGAVIDHDHPAEGRPNDLTYGASR